MCESPGIGIQTRSVRGCEWCYHEQCVAHTLCSPFISWWMCVSLSGQGLFKQIKPWVPRVSLAVIQSFSPATMREVKGNSSSSSKLSKTKRSGKARRRPPSLSPQAERRILGWIASHLCDARHHASLSALSSLDLGSADVDQERLVLSFVQDVADSSDLSSIDKAAQSLAALGRQRPPMAAEADTLAIAFQTLVCGRSLAPHAKTKYIRSHLLACLRFFVVARVVLKTI